MKPGEPAVTELGLIEARVAPAAALMLKFNALDAGRPGSTTVMGTVPGSRSKLAETCAVN